MITVGIDITKYKHTYCIADDLAPIYEFEFDNPRQGFYRFYKALLPHLSSHK